jgi:hypothetical protein
MSAAHYTVNRRTMAAIAALVLLVAGLSRLDRADALTGGVPPGEGITIVIVASGVNFPDALGAGPIAAVAGAPIILVPVNPPLDASTIETLQGLDPQGVLIIGGTSAVSQATQDAIVSLLPNAIVERVSGSNRYQTNSILVQAIYPVQSTVSIPAPAFSAVNPDSQVAEIGPNIAHSSSLLYAPVNLPDGARIVKVTLAGVDATGADGVGIRLQRTTASTVETIAQIFSGDAFDDGTFFLDSLSVTNEFVDNDFFGYIIEVYASQSDRYVSNVFITYEFGPPG